MSSHSGSQPRLHLCVDALRGDGALEVHRLGRQRFVRRLGRPLGVAAHVEIKSKA